MLRNLIKEVLSNEGMSINQLSQKLGMTYANTHALVNREDLSDTKLGNLVDVARILDVEVNDLFEVVLADPYDFREVKVLDEAISLVEKKSNTRSVSEKTYEEFNRLKDEIEEYGVINKELVNNVKKEIIESAKYAGYTNIQYRLLEDVRRILDTI